CKVFTTVTVTSPPAITISLADKTDPSCVGSKNGMLTVAASGGNGGLTYQWNSGPATALLDNIGAGTYQVTVSDQKGCSASASFTLADPVPFTVDLGPDKAICTGQEVAIGVTIANATYMWTGPDNFQAAAAVVIASKTGTYSVTVTNQNGCTAQDHITMVASDNLLKADLLMVSKAHVKDTIVVIDISWPLPESVEWSFDPKATIIFTEPDYAGLTFHEPGTYTVGIKARLAQCVSTYTQAIEILPEEESSGGRKDNGSIITVFNAFPNPFNDELNVSVTLDQEELITISLINLGINKVIFREQVKEARFEKVYDFNSLDAGIYILLIEAGGESRTTRLVKQ
ncbi:MAG: T9SS type A sorting domain-containing protein, partial [Bacteroidota bacterium]